MAAIYKLSELNLNSGFDASNLLERTKEGSLGVIAQVTLAKLIP